MGRGGHQPGARPIYALVQTLLPCGRREGHEWRVGSIAGETGSSLGVHLTGRKSGLWADFALGIGGDALDLVRAVLGVSLAEAMAWSRHWLGIKNGKAEPPRQSETKQPDQAATTSDRWRWPWNAASPISGTAAETYFEGRGLAFDDPGGRVLRFAARRARKGPDGDLQHHPALLAALSDARTGDQCGIINVFLKGDGSDRLRDRKGKTISGRARDAAVMLSAFDEPTMGLVLCEGPETGIAIFQTGLQPIWAVGGAGNLTRFPLLGGVGAMMIAADADEPGQRAAEALAARWRSAGREAVIVAPPAGDWADRQ